MKVNQHDLVTALRQQSKDSKPTPAFNRQLWRELETKMPNQSWLSKLLPSWQPQQFRLVGMVVILLVGLGLVRQFSSSVTFYGGPKVDDWQYDQQQVADSAVGRIANTVGQSLNSFSQNAPNAGVGAPMKMMAESSSMMMDSAGFAVGGAKDINNFRENIKNGYLPLPTDITVEGLFYDYFFDATNQKLSCSELFCPTYSTATSTNPLTSASESYLSVGLTGGDQASRIERPNLNLVVVLDISGSMSSQFDQYYYDQQTGERVEGEADSRSKMKIATDSINSMLDHLQPNDQVAVVLFDDEAYLAKPLSTVKNTDMNALQKHISELTPQGGTDQEAGMQEATQLLGDATSNANTETRMVVLTDAMPNTGNTGRADFMDLMEQNANKGIHTTFVGIGVDFNSDLIESITKVKGANYYSVHSAKEFEERVDQEFDFMVTPMVYDLELTLKSDAWEIEQVYGSPEANQATGEIMKVNTLFPSASTDEGVKGGVVLLKVKPKAGVQLEQEWPLWGFTTPTASAKLVVSYKDRAGQRFTNTQDVVLQPSSQNRYDNSGIRKAILLARWAELLQNWTATERNITTTPSIMPMIEPDFATDDWNYNQPDSVFQQQHPNIGYPGIPYPTVQPSQWERGSMPLRLSPQYRTKFEQFGSYLVSEKQAIGDQDLQKEVELLDKITKSSQ